MNNLPYKYKLKACGYSQLNIHGITLYVSKWIHQNKRNIDLDKYNDLVQFVQYDPQIETLDSEKVIKKDEVIIDQIQVYHPNINEEEKKMGREQLKYIDGKPIENIITQKVEPFIFNNTNFDEKPFKVKIIKESEININQIDFKKSKKQKIDYAIKMVKPIEDESDENKVIDLSNIETGK